MTSTGSNWTQEEVDQARKDVDAILRKHWEALSNVIPAMSTTPIEIACQRNALREALKNLVALSWIDVGSVCDEAKQILEKCK